IKSPDLRLRSIKSPVLKELISYFNNSSSAFSPHSK
ncbi:hypothetical protein ACN38_g9974, partial [Penicillium nordicum]